MKAYIEYLNEKLGGVLANPADKAGIATHQSDIDRDEYDQVLEFIAKAVIEDEKGLGHYVSQATIQTADTVKIVKELFKSPFSKERERILAKVMDIEALWDYDSADIEKVLEQLHSL